MILSRFQVYLVGLLIFFTPMIIYKLIWLSRSREATGVVTRIVEKRARRGYISNYPEIIYKVEGKQYRLRGPSNSEDDFSPGDIVSVRYIRANPARSTLNTFWSCWIDVVLVNGFILVFWTFLFGRKVITGKRFLISRKGIGIAPENVEIPYAEVVESRQIEHKL